MLIVTLVVTSAAMVMAHENHQQHAGEVKEHANPLKNTKDQADHIMEELNEIMKTKAKEEMTDKELQFHYFKLHDFDNNNRLDGTEIVKAMTHHHEDANKPAWPKLPDIERLPWQETALSVLDGEANFLYVCEGISKDNLPPVQSDSELADIIDAILSTDDTNKDGYIDFLEFMKSTVEA